MNATQTGNTHTPNPTTPVPFTLGAAILEGIHFAQMMAIQSSQAWLHAVEETIKAEHDLLMAMRGYRPQEHVAPWDSLDTSNGESWLAALDKGLCAAGE